MGGDCLNFGCVPSKALLAAAKAAETCRGAWRFGVTAGEPVIDFAAVQRHVQGVIATIAPTDSVERYEGLGVRVIRAPARFTGPRELIAGKARIRARRFVVATGSSPAIPAIPGLAAVPHLTNETLFDLTRRPDHLIIVGGGPIGIEIAQAHARLGSRVTVVEAARVLAKDDPELAELLRLRLVAEGIDIHEGAANLRIERAGDGVAVVLAGEAATAELVGSHLLVATGRAPNVTSLALDAAGIAHDRQGITVDAGCAPPTAASSPSATSPAARNSPICRLSRRHRHPQRAVPPPGEGRLSRHAVGHLYRSRAGACRVDRGGGAPASWPDIAILRASFHENDRAQAERTVSGLVKIVTRKSGRILGASILGAHAGELIQPWVLAIGQGLKIGAFAGMIAPYPTLGEAGKRAAGSYFIPKLFTDRTRRIVRFLTGSAEPAAAA